MSYEVTAGVVAYEVQADLSPYAVVAGTPRDLDTGLPPLTDSLELYVNAMYPTGF